MNTRKIQYAVESLGKSTFGVKIDGKHVATMAEVQWFVGEKGVKFARRAFAGATRLTLILHKSSYNGNWFKDGSELSFCENDCRKFFNLGKNTKTFSLWYKRV